MEFLEIVADQTSFKHRLKALVRTRNASGPDTVWDYLQNELPDYKRELPDWTWIVAGNLSSLNETEIEKLTTQKVLLGPNIHFENPEVSRVVKRMGHRKIVAPSEWVANYLGASGIEIRGRIVVWASTVDPNEWVPVDSSRDSVLIYMKDFSKHELLMQVTQCLSSKGIKYNLLNYGNYSKKDFKRLLNRSSWAIWIGSTESQGLALLESWFMNVPTLVLESKVFTGLDGSSFSASSAPYLNPECGRFFSLQDNIPTIIATFQSELPNYNPRSWALKNFSHKNVLRSLLDSLASNEKP
jgi:hypothetical protein